MNTHIRNTTRRIAAAAACIAIGAASCASSAEPEPPTPAATVPPATATTAAAVETRTEKAAPAKTAQVEIPDVTGQRAGDARRELRIAGITGDIDSGDDNDATVTDQQPPAGRTVPADTSVTLHTTPAQPPTDTADSDNTTSAADEDSGGAADTAQPATVGPDPVLAAVATPGWMEANGAVPVDDTGLMWVPWAPFGDDADPQLIAERDRWDKTMPPLLDWAETKLRRGEPIAREKQDKPGHWQDVVDTTGLDVHLHEHATGVTKEITVCPSRLGEATAETKRRRVEMLSPGGLAIHSLGWSHNRLSFLLAWSPGEPMSTAGARFLADWGLVPGDWSEAAIEVLVREAAIGAIIEELVSRAAMSAAPDSLWEACMDAASTALTSTRRAGTWGITLQQLWSSGLRLEHEAPPPERVWIEMLDAEARAMTVMCRPAETIHLVDASTTQSVGTFEHRAESVVAMSLSWTGDRWRLAHWHEETGRCEQGSDAWSAAIAQIGLWAEADSTDVDMTKRWAEGVRQPWLRIARWVHVPQAVAWEAHRETGLLARLWCEIGPPALHPLDSDKLRPEIEPFCTAEQKARMLAQAADAPAVTPAMSAYVIGDGEAWADRTDNDRRSVEDVLGCDPSEAEVAADLASRPIEPTLKRPWPPGVLPGSPTGGWPLPAVPCPGVAWPAFGDERFWWPESMAPVGAAGERRGQGVE